MNIGQLKSVCFLGIGGIGMSALARYFNSLGIQISGYDKTPTSLTDQLMQEGMKIHFEEDIDQIPRDADLFVYTPAIPKDNANGRNNQKPLKVIPASEWVNRPFFNIK